MGHEGNEEGDEGNESDEGHEGNEEGNEEACHEEGGRGRGPDEEARNESDEGHEGNEEGDESNESDEGHEEVIAQYGPRRQSAELIGHGGVPRRALYTVPVLENIQSSAL